MSAIRPVVVLALTPVAEQAIEALLFGPEAPLEPRASIAEADELESEATLVDAEAVLLSPGLSGLSAGHCARVRARGLRLIGLALDAREREALAALGVDEIATPNGSADELLVAIRGDNDTLADLKSPAAPRDAAESKRAGGNLLAVVGSKGAPGASECAASLAALASARWACVLVDLDMLGGGLDIRLGADAHQGSLLGLLRAADSGESALRELLERWLATRPGWPPVLLGPPDLEKALPELARPGATAACLHALASVYPLCVADVGFLLGEGKEQPAAARVHREALVSADAVLLVLGARDQQLRAGLNQLDLLLSELGLRPEKLRIVLNGVGEPGADPKRSLEATLAERLAERGLALDARLPFDRRALTRSTSRGQPFAAARRRGGYGRALSALLEELFLPVAPTPRGRKQKLVPPQPQREDEEVSLPWQS